MLGWLTRTRTLSALGVTLLTAASLAVPAATPAATAGERLAPDRFERRVVYWTNVMRHRRGLPDLRLRECPERHAERWARHLARTGRFYHQDVTEMFSCRRVNVAGENLARGRMTPRQTVRAWMDSAPHRENLLERRFSHLGVGAVYSRVDGRLYVSQTFTGR